MLLGKTILVLYMKSMNLKCVWLKSACWLDKNIFYQPIIGNTKLTNITWFWHQFDAFVEWSKFLYVFRHFKLRRFRATVCCQPQLSADGVFPAVYVGVCVSQSDVPPTVCSLPPSVGENIVTQYREVTVSYWCLATVEIDGVVRHF